MATVGRKKDDFTYVYAYTREKMLYYIYGTVPPSCAYLTLTVYSRFEPRTNARYDEKDKLY